MNIKTNFETNVFKSIFILKDTEILLNPSRTGNSKNSKELLLLFGVNTENQFFCSKSFSSLTIVFQFHHFVLKTFHKLSVNVEELKNWVFNNLFENFNSQSNYMFVRVRRSYVNWLSMQQWFCSRTNKSIIISNNK